MKFEDRSHEQTERQQRCVRNKAWNLAKKTCTSSKKLQDYILFALGGVGTPGCVKKKKSEEREFVVDSGASMHMVR